MQTAKGTILHNNWDEKPYNEVDGLKSTEANIDIVMQGDAELTGKSRSLMQFFSGEGRFGENIPEVLTRHAKVKERPTKMVLETFRTGES